MRLFRILFILLALYFTFIGGSSRYQTSLAIRMLHHGVVTLICVGWLLNRIRHCQGLPHTALNNAIFAMIGVWFITALTSIDLRMALEHLWFPITHTILFFIIIDLLQKDHHRLIMESVFLMATMVIFLTGLELASWYFGLGIIPNTIVGWAEVGMIPNALPRVSMVMSISTLVAGYVVPLIILAFVWGISTHRKDYRIVLLPLSILLLIVLLLTFSRGGLLAFLVAFAMWLLIRALQNPTMTNKIPQRWLGVGGVSLTLGLIGLFVAVTLPFAVGASDKGRLDLWRSAIEITRDNPIVGVGPGLFGKAFRDYRDSDIARDKLASAHNAPLNTASETGLLGIAVSLWLGWLIIREGYRSWQQTISKKQRYRIEGVALALVGLSVHSMVDVFTITPIVLILLIGVAFLVEGYRTESKLPTASRIPAVILLVIVVAYGITWIPIDTAQNHYQQFFTDDDPALIQTARQLDPSLYLYDLHHAYHLGQSVNENTIDPAIQAYEHALELEPTWDVGWINLASLAERRGNIDEALAYLQTAWRINPLTTAPLHWARLAEAHNTASDDEILSAYRLSLKNLSPIRLPLSSFWWDTPLRQQALREFYANRSIQLQYRIYRAHDLETADTLVPDNPQTADEWWVKGEHELTQNNEPQLAEEYFTRAIELSTYNGDFYASRARARQFVNLEVALLDLDIATVLGTRFEFPNATRANLTVDPQQVFNYRFLAVPQRNVQQEFAAVFFTRPAIFDVYPSMRYPYLDRTILNPWYQIAETFLAEGKTENAIRVYQAILEQAPYQTEARDQLRTLQSNSR